MWHTARMISLPRLAALGLMAAGLAVAAGASRLSLTDVFQLETARDPQISPDGKRIVYVRAFADIMGIGR
jgi:hypothetical protein